MAVKSGENVEVAHFDTDSDTCGIDNWASASMSPHKADFKGERIKEKRVIRGFEGAKVYTIYNGTLFIPIEDDEGKTDEVKIPNLYYVPTCSYRIISPQHWAQEVKDTTDDETGCIMYSDRPILFWQGGTRKKTVEINQQNVFTFALLSGYKRFHAMCATCHIDPWREDDKPETVEQTDLVCQLIHPERDDPGNKYPELISKVQRFYPNNVSCQKSDHAKTDIS
jgi:hypothetical protein